MIDITSIALSGYRSYGDRQEIKFAPGVYLLAGDNRDRGVSSAAGKSSIFKALCCALFEYNDDMSVKDGAIKNGWRHGLCIEVDLVVDGVQYRIVYARKHKEHGNAWSVLRHDGISWVDESGHTMLDTKAKIQSILGLNYDQFTSCAYVPQHQIADFIYRTDKERKQVLSHLLSLEVCDGWAARAHELERESQRELTQVEAEISASQAYIDSDVEDINIDACKAEVIAATERYNTLAAEYEDARKVHAAAEAYSAMQSSLASLKQQLTQKHHQRQMIQADVDKLALPPDAATKQASMQQELYHLRAQATQLTNRIHKLQAVSGVCPECEQAVPPEHVQGLVQKYTEEYNSVSAQMGSLTTALSELATKLADLSRLQAAITKIDAEITSLGNTISSTESSMPPAPPESLPNIQEIYSQCQAAHNALASAKAKLGAAESAMRRRAAAVARLESLRTRREALASQVDKYHRLAYLAGDKGFKLHKISTCIDIFNASMSRYLSILYNGEVSAVLTIKKDNVDILVTDGDKQSVPIRQYSGGEKALIGMAIMCAVWDVAAAVSRHAVNLLLLDEPFANMDSYGEERACLLLSHLRQSNRTVIVVTNRDDLADRGAFDGEYRVTKAGGTSTITFRSLGEAH